MASTRTTDRGGRPPKRPTGRWRGALVSAVLVGLAAWVLAPAGIIELGKKGQKSKKSLFLVSVDGEDFAISPPAGTDATVILDALIADINLDADFSAVRVVDPDPLYNAMEVVITANGSDPDSLDVLADDTGIQDVSIENGDVNRPSQPPVFRFWGLRNVQGNSGGNVTMSITTLPVASKGDPNAVVLSTASVSTVGKTAEDVNDDLVQALRGQGFQVQAAGKDRTYDVQTYIVHKADHFVLSVSWDTTDDGAWPNAVAQPPSMRNPIPTLTEWGMVALVALLAASALLVLRRRRAANTS